MAAAQHITDALTYMVTQGNLLPDEIIVFEPKVFGPGYFAGYCTNRCEWSPSPPHHRFIVNYTITKVALTKSLREAFADCICLACRARLYEH